MTGREEAIRFFFMSVEALQLEACGCDRLLQTRL
jgi:hypothetical protein